MKSRYCNSFYVVSLAVLSISAADVFIINAKPAEKSPVSVTIDRSLQTLQKLLGKKINDENSLRLPLLSSNIKKSGNDKVFMLRPALSSDLTKTNVAELLRLINANRNVIKPTFRTPTDNYRLFHNMYSVPKKLKVYGFKKPARPYGPYESTERLQPLIKLLLSNMVPKHTFTDLTRFDPSNLTEDYIDLGEMVRKKQNRYSRDYIDLDNLDNLKFRRNEPYAVKAALRTYSVESNDASSESTKLKRFEIIKNKQNKKDIKSSETEEVKYKKKKKATFKKKSHKKKDLTIEDAGTSLSSDSISKERVKQKSKKRHQPKKKKEKFVSQENDEWHDNDEEVGLYLQGNKLTMYPPVDKDSSDENDSDGTRRRGDRLPYFLPKRNHWHMDEIHNLGYFFFDGPKGLSLERENLIR